MLTLVESQDLKTAARFTLDNMQTYYDMYDVDWGVEEVYEATKGLMNFDVLSDGKPVGVLRLSFDDERCQLRDIQISESNQGKGYGAEIISKVVEMTREKGLDFIDLKVFQRSPAHRLYSRVGFNIVSEDDRFYYMTLSL